MRVLDGDRSLVRIFAGESDRWGHQPPARALLERLLPLLDEMLTRGALVTIERVRVLNYAARDVARPPAPGGA